MVLPLPQQVLVADAPLVGLDELAAEALAEDTALPVCFGLHNIYYTPAPLLILLYMRISGFEYVLDAITCGWRAATFS